MGQGEAIFVDELVGGWAGRTHRPHSVAHPGTLDDLRRAIELASSQSRSVIAMGAGCSYADQIQNRDGVVIDCRGLAGIQSWNPESGRVSVLAGTTLSEILKLALPSGWTVGGVPGSFMVTVGGAIANNVHGKDAHRWSFSSGVRGVDLLGADGTIRKIEPDADRKLFHAVVGGLGLLGIVVAADLQLVRIPSPWLDVEVVRTKSLRHSFEVFRERQTRDFALAWLDGLATGSARGRGVISFAKWASRLETVPRERIDQALMVNDRWLGIIPSAWVWRAGAPMLRPPGLRLTNMIYHALAIRQSKRLVPFPDFYFLYNRINGLDEAYRPHGFAEIQAMMPRDGELEVCNAMLDLLERTPYRPIFMTMKGHVQDDCLLGFPGDGLSVTIGLRKPGGDRARFRSVLAGLFELIGAAGGRVNLSKDEFLSAEQFARMYPAAAEFTAIKQRLDPRGLFQSDQYRRLFAAGVA